MVQGSGFKGSGLNSEPQNRRIMNRRMSKGGFALLNLFYKIDRSTTEAHDGQNTFLRHSTCPQCLYAGGRQLLAFIHNSMITLTQHTMHGRRVFNIRYSAVLRFAV
jgi:hypothetical protein